MRDYFDTHKNVETQIIRLSAPTAGRTRAHRSVLGKKRNAKIKAGLHVVKPRGKPNAPRIMRVGAPGSPHRPTPEIVGNTVSVPEKDAA